MKRFFLLIAVLLGTVSTNANAWFFFYIPPGVLNAIGDSISGAEGDSCVATSAKIGDIIKFPSGSTATVKSLSGTSSRCKDASLPIRALTESAPAPTAASNSQPFSGFAPVAVASVESNVPDEKASSSAAHFASPFQTTSVLSAPDYSLVPISRAASAGATIPVAAPPAAPRPSDATTVADKLRELNKLFKEEVITQEEFDTKKKVLLTAM